MPQPELVGRLSERMARSLGTNRYLVGQTILVACWIGLNVVAVRWRFDPCPFVLLNLIFSAQAAYAAPLILLAHSRQNDRDRISLGQDRARTKETQTETQYLTRELAALHIAIAELPTRVHLRGEVAKLLVEPPPLPRMSGPSSSP